jgi:hypothetical protein
VSSGANAAAARLSPEHYRKRGLCRAFKSLSCVFYRAHGKEALCRAPNKTHGKECVLFSDARQRFFAVRFNFGLNLCRAF